MFTGLVEGLSEVTATIAEPGGIRIELAPPQSLATDDVIRDAVRCGDSIAINGCCLTVVAIEGGHWSFQAGQETLSKTNLGRLRVGDFANIERSLPVGGRLGGHFVQGHVDGVGILDQNERDADWVTMGFSVSATLANFMVSKGSVAVDGVSLTLVTVEAERFTVALIPHTLAATTLGSRSVGDSVNIETDILGKYVRSFLKGTINN